jgi:hypothetical protein
MVASHRKTTSDQLSTSPGSLRLSGVKVFSATVHGERIALGQRVTNWLAARPHIQVIDIVVTQSSDYDHHCVSMSLFYWNSSDVASR